MLRKMILRLMAGVLAASMIISSSMTAFAGVWRRGEAPYEDKWWYDKDGKGKRVSWGSYGTLEGNFEFRDINGPTNQWMWIDGNNDGIAECYYFDEEGWLLTNTTTPDGQTVNADGAWIVNGVVQTQVSEIKEVQKWLDDSYYPEIYKDDNGGDFSPEWDYSILWSINISQNKLIYRLRGEENTAKDIYSQEEEDAVYKKLNTFFKKHDYMEDYSDWEKIEAITDYLWKNSRYDRRDNPGGNSVYEVIVQGKGKCDEYACTFMVMARVAGLECYYAKSAVHSWNKIMIDGEWYNIDVTRPENKNFDYDNYRESMCFTDEDAQTGYTRKGWRHPGNYYNDMPFGKWPECTATEYTFID